MYLSDVEAELNLCLKSSYSTRLDECMHSELIESKAFATARMGDDSPPVNLPKYRINIYFLSAFPLFLKPSCLLIHVMMVLPRTSLNSHSYAKNHK